MTPLMIPPIALGSALVLTLGPTLAEEAMPLAEAKLIIEHNATDADTGFQGFLDGEGWRQLTISGPDGEVVRFEGQSGLMPLGLTELFFETVEPFNADVPLPEILAGMPEGKYSFEGVLIGGGTTAGTAELTYAIPAGPVLTAPEADAVVPAGPLIVAWEPVAETITGEPVTIVAYLLVIEKDVEPHPHMIGKFGLSMHLPPSVTSVEIASGFLEAGSAYSWEVLAIEESGNQTLSSAAFTTE